MSLITAINAAVAGADYSEQAADAPARVIDASAAQLYAARIAGRVEGANAERQRIREIFASAAAKRLPDFAVEFAFATDATAKNVIALLERQAASATPAAGLAGLDVGQVYADRKAQITGRTPTPQPEASGNDLDPATIIARRAAQARAAR